MPACGGDNSGFRLWLRPLQEGIQGVIDVNGMPEPLPFGIPPSNGEEGEIECALDEPQRRYRDNGGRASGQHEAAIK